MSLYREPGRRGRAWVAIAVGAAVVALLAGVAIGRATKSTPTLASQVADVQGRTQRVIDGLDLVRIHYRRDPAAALAQAKRARSDFDDVSGDLTALNPRGAALAASELDRTVALAARHAAFAAVSAEALRARGAVRRAAGLAAT